MNGPIRKVGVFFAVIFAMLLANISVSTIVRADALNSDPTNTRVSEADFDRFRGAILVGNTPVAQTVPNDGRFRYRRSYPKGADYAAVTGFFTHTYGRSGLERAYNAELAGTASSQAFNRFVDLISGRSPVGASLQTTIDARAQAAANKGLGDRWGAVVALDYKTGAVLALASSPSFDPAELATTDLEAATKSWQTLNEASGDPLKNHAVTEIYPPGSTFKLVTAAAALESGLKPDTQIDSPSALALPGSSHAMTNSSDCGGTKITLQHALAVSCNTAFGKLAMDLGADKLRAQAEAFGFNSKPELDVRTAASKYPKTVDQAQLALSGIGQYEVAASPLQMAMIGAAIANDGTMMKPRLVSEVRAQDLSILATNPPKEQGKPISQETARALQQMMVSTVAEGTGTRAQIDGVVVGGKTGTAQSAPSRPPYAWFVGYADEPHVAVAVFVRNAEGTADDISGGRIAAPVAKAVIEALR